jgi:hypothetical protein
MRPIFLAAFALLAACRSAPPADESVQLRTYDVPKGPAGSLVRTISDVMWLGGESRNVGRAVVTPDGRLAVLAAPGVHSGVETLVDEVKKHPPIADQTVTLHYFLLIGNPAPSAQPYPAGVGEIKDALDEIVRSQGPQAFTLAKRAGLSSFRDDEGRLDDNDAKLEIRQTAAQTDDGTYARLSIRWKEDKLETRVHLAPDRMVVLGTTGAHAGDNADGATLYYIVRVAPRPDGKAP